MKHKIFFLTFFAFFSAVTAFGEEVSLFYNAWTSTENYFGNESFNVKLDNRVNTVHLRLDVANVKSHRNTYLVINGVNVVTGNGDTGNLEIGGTPTSVTPYYGWECYVTVDINPKTGKAAVLWSTASGGNRATGEVDLGAIGATINVSIPEFPGNLAMCFDELSVWQEHIEKEIWSGTAKLVDEVWDYDVVSTGGYEFTGGLVSATNPITLVFEGKIRNNKAPYLTLNGVDVLSGDSDSYVRIGGERKSSKGYTFNDFTATVVVDPVSGSASVLWKNVWGTEFSGEVDLGDFGMSLTVGLPVLPENAGMNYKSLSVTQDYETEPNSFDCSGARILFAIGDSITQGVRGGGRGGSWAKFTANGLGAECINDALSGSKLSAWYAVLTGRPGLNGETGGFDTPGTVSGLDKTQLENRIKAADVMVFTLGFNDLNIEHNDPDELADELADFVAAVHAVNPDVKIVAVGSSKHIVMDDPMPEGFVHATYPELYDYIPDFTFHAVRVLNSYPYRDYCAFVDCTDIFSEEWCYTPCSDGEPDGIHPGYDGYMAVAERVLDVVFDTPLATSEPPKTTVLSETYKGVTESAAAGHADYYDFGGHFYNVRLDNRDGLVVLKLRANVHANYDPYLVLNGTTVLAGDPVNAHTFIGGVDMGVYNQYMIANITVVIDPRDGKAIVTWATDSEGTLNKSETNIGTFGKRLSVEIPKLTENKPMMFDYLKIEQWPGAAKPLTTVLLFK